jgi:hypothetical protein
VIHAHDCLTKLSRPGAVQFVSDFIFTTQPVVCESRSSVLQPGLAESSGGGHTWNARQGFWDDSSGLGI